MRSFYESLSKGHKHKLCNLYKQLFDNKNIEDISITEEHSVVKFSEIYEIIGPLGSGGFGLVLSGK